MSHNSEHNKEYIEGIKTGIMASWKAIAKNSNITLDVFTNDVIEIINKNNHIDLHSDNLLKELKADIEHNNKDINFTNKFVKHEHNHDTKEKDSLYNPHNDSDTASFTASFMAIRNDSPKNDEKDIVSLLYNDANEDIDTINDNTIIENSEFISDEKISEKDNEEAILEEAGTIKEEYSTFINEIDDASVDEEFINDFENENTFVIDSSENNENETIVEKDHDMQEEPQKHGVLSALRTLFSHGDTQNVLEDDSSNISENTNKLLSDWDKAAADIDKELNGRMWGVKASDEHIAAINKIDDQLKNNMTGFFEKADMLEQNETEESVMLNDETSTVETDTDDKSNNTLTGFELETDIPVNTEITESLNEEVIITELSENLAESENKNNHSTEDYDAEEDNKEKDNEQFDIINEENNDADNTELIDEKAMQLAPEFFSIDNEKDNHENDAKNSGKISSGIESLIDMEAFEDGRTSVESVKKTPVSDVKLPSEIVDE